MSAIISRSPEDTESLARELAPRLAPGDLVSLVGDLGAGKTCFVRGLASGLGIDPRLVHSPTYVLANEYPIPGSACVLVHADAYRLTDTDEHESLALDRLADGSAIVVLEWPRRLPELPTEPALTVTIDHIDETTREITLAGAPRLVSS